MVPSIRKLVASALLGGTVVLPVFAGDKPAAVEVPANQKLTARQLHEHLAKGSGWVRFKTDTGTNNGTGWIVDKVKKLMITNAHVVDNKDTVQVIFPEWKDGKLVREETAYDKVEGVKATVIDRDESRDLALLLLESVPETSHVLKMAAAEPEEGDNVRTIGGFTLGGEGLVWGAVRGEVRTVGPVIGWRGNAKVRKISTDAPINGGNSGGPLVNEAGEVVGVNASYQTNARNVSHHISIVEVKAYLKVTLPLANPETGAQYLLRGQRRLDVYRNDVAIKDFSAAIKKDDKLADAYHLRGKAFLRTGDAATALDDLNTAMKLDVGNYDYHVTRGKAFLALKKGDEAQLDFSAAIRIDPSQGLAYNERAVSHYRAAKYELALADFSRAIEKDKETPLYFANRAESLNALGRFEECAKDWAAAVQLAPWNVEYQLSCGFAYIDTGKHDACLEAFQAAVKLDPQPKHIVYVAIGQRLTGDYKTAMKTVNDAIAKYGDGAKPNQLYPAYYNRGMLHAALKDYKRAVEDLNKAIELSDGKNFYAFVERAKAFKAAGDEAAATADFATATKLGWKSGVKPVETALAPKGLVGTWKASFDCKLGKVTQTLTLEDDGSYTAKTTIVGDDGTEIVNDAGTYKLGQGVLTMESKAAGTLPRKLGKVSATTMEVEIKEVATTATFTKVK